jgi:thiamine biosynthesis lipoprotein
MLELYSFEFFAMGTSCVFHLYAADRDGAGAAAQSAISEVHRIEDRYSRYRSDSFLSRVNRVALEAGTIEVDEETALLLDYACLCYDKSGGLFDISSGVLRKAWDFSSRRVPDKCAIDKLLPLVGLDKISWQKPLLTFSIPGMELDFGGIGKEYAADRAADVCISSGIEYGVIDLGGDIRIIGPHPYRGPWNIKIRHPRQPDSFMADVDVERGAIASSGDYERFIEVDGKRYCHIINPLTGSPVRQLSSVTVFADQCLVAGTVCTIAMLKEENGIEWLKASGVRYVCMDENGGVQGTGPFHVPELD